jgi:hypothetical protein
LVKNSDAVSWKVDSIIRLMHLPSARLEPTAREACIWSLGMSSRCSVAALLISSRLISSTHAQLIKFGERTVGGPFTWAVLKHTFAAQYTGGETVEEVCICHQRLGILAFTCTGCLHRELCLGLDPHSWNR